MREESGLVRGRGSCEGERSCEGGGVLILMTALMVNTMMVI